MLIAKNRSWHSRTQEQCCQMPVIQMPKPTFFCNELHGFAFSIRALRYRIYGRAKA